MQKDAPGFAWKEANVFRLCIVLDGTRFDFGEGGHGQHHPHDIGIQACCNGCLDRLFRLRIDVQGIATAIRGWRQDVGTNPI